ncbi:acyltransferase [Fictibacillus sp. BK138]|uniref:acyltransferase n=1 Tax=Fictibacillus sp. BK138 TaxID=2512121 RepID=UPI0010DDC7AD|nr:acyltransferase [Fictibacillus sp. BK138]RZT21376.1 maltose O-acetyltransferase [Fictibacillus sp. BK138]
MLKRIKHHAWSFLVNVIGGCTIFPKRVRWRWYRIFGINNDRINVNSHCYFRTPNVVIGKNSFLNNRCFIESNARVTIGTDCCIAMDVIIGSDTHELGDSKRRAGKVISLPITIGDGCWIGARSTILAGVTIGEGCIIAAGSVVIKDCKPNSLYAGVPAIWKKDL